MPDLAPTVASVSGGDLAKYIVDVLAFAVILWLLGRYLAPVLSRIMAQRQEAIGTAIGEAERGQRARQQAEADYEARLAEARDQARSLLEQATTLGQQVREEMRRKADEEYQTMIARARAEIERATERASAELRHELAHSVVDTTRRVLARELTPELHRGLIDDVIAEVESRA